MRLFAASLLFLLVIATASCQHSTAVTPSTPSTGALSTAPLSSTVPEQQGFGLLAIDLDPETLTVSGTVQALPESREGQAGLESVNLTSYLTNKPCSDCLRVAGVKQLPGGELGLTIAIRHPFPAGDPTGTPSASNRLDLHVYNVEGVLFLNRQERKTVFSGIGQTAADLLVTNADGYSANLAPALPGLSGLGVSLYPYKVFFRDYTQGNFSASSGYADVTAPRGYMVMGMGSAPDERTFNVKLPPGSGPQRLYLYAQASWGVSSQPPGSLLAPQYRVPEFTKKAASEVTAQILDNALTGGGTSSTARLRLKVLDTNADATVGTGLGQIAFTSQVASIEVEVPALMASKITVANPTPVQGQPRNINNPLVYDITLTNSKGAAQGTYLGLAKVQDSWPAGQSGAALENKDVLDQPGQSSPLQFTRTLTDYSTYVVFLVDIGGFACPTDLAFVNNAPTDPVLGLTYSYTFTATGGTAPYTYSLESGSLPTGITLSSTGVLSGTASSRADFFTVFNPQIKVTDSCSIPQSVTLTPSLRVDLQKMTFVFFDVGQGQSTLVYSAAKDAILIDTGPGNQTLGTSIMNYMRSRGLNLKYVVDSHWHEDHHGNIAYVIGGPDGRPGRRNVDDDGDGSTDSFEDAEEYGWPGSDDFMPEKCFDNGEFSAENQQSDRIWKAAVSSARVPFSPSLLGDKNLMSLSEPGLELFLGTGSMACFNGTNFGHNADDENSNSISVMFRHGGFDAEVGGDLQGTNGGDSTDMETTYANALAASGVTLDVVCAHHHGSSDGNNSTWFNVLRPEIVIVSCDDDNPYGHPHQPTLDRIGTIIGSTMHKLYVTTGGTLLPRTFMGQPLASAPKAELNAGTIVIETDGRTYTITSASGTVTHNVDQPLP